MKSTWQSKHIWRSVSSISFSSFFLVFGSLLPPFLFWHGKQQKPLLFFFQNKTNKQVEINLTLLILCSCESFPRAPWSSVYHAKCKQIPQNICCHFCSSRTLLFVFWISPPPPPVTVVQEEVMNDWSAPLLLFFFHSSIWWPHYLLWQVPAVCGVYPPQSWGGIWILSL